MSIGISPISFCTQSFFGKNVSSACRSNNDHWRELTGDSLTLDDDARKDKTDHDENLERCKLILTGMDDDALRIAGRPFFKINWRFADFRRRRPENRMYHDEIPERCKLNFTELLTTHSGSLANSFQSKLFKNTLERKLKLTPTDDLNCLQENRLKVNSEREQDSPVEMGASNISRFKEMPFLKAKRHRAHSVVSGVRVKASKPKKTIPRLGIISARRHRSNP
ncbi:hypothetical protein TNCV_1634771 [Trichonephila clavipes]|nr:hypothetical protein TNCV_1634771 [Trichonephila clavipes]